MTRDEKGRFVKGVSGNPNGRPPIDNSWAGIIREVMEATAQDLAKAYGNDNQLGQAFRTFPKDVPMKRLLAGRLLTALMFEPTPGLLTALMDREEGKVPDQIQHSGSVGVKWDWEPPKTNM